MHISGSNCPVFEWPLRRLGTTVHILQHDTLQRHNTENSKQYITRKGIAWPQSPFPPSGVCEQFFKNIFPQSVCLFCCRKICGPILGIYKSLTDANECGNWDWDRAIPFLGIHKWDFRCSSGRTLGHCPRGILAWPTQIISNEPSPEVAPLHLCTIEVSSLLQSMFSPSSFKGTHSCEIFGGIFASPKNYHVALGSSGFYFCIICPI